MSMLRSAPSIHRFTAIARLGLPFHNPSARQQFDALKAFVLFEFEDFTHQIVSVDFRKRQGKRETLAGRELAGGAVAGLVAP